MDVNYALSLLDAHRLWERWDVHRVTFEMSLILALCSLFWITPPPPSIASHDKREVLETWYLLGQKIPGDYIIKASTTFVHVSLHLHERFSIKKIRFCRVLRIPVFCICIQTFDKSYYRNQNAVFWWNAARGCYVSWTNFNSSFMHYLTQNAMMDIPLISECILMLIHNFNLYQHVSEHANIGLLRELSYFPNFVCNVQMKNTINRVKWEKPIWGFREN